MQPELVVCPTCGEETNGRIGVHSLKERRYKCHECGKTFAEAVGTPLYNLKTASWLVIAILKLLANGRVEIREIWAFSPHEHAEHFRTLNQWTTIQTVIMVKSERRLNGKVEVETRYYISSLAEHAQVLLVYIRQHWGIENSLHWVLDVAFQQDAQWIRKANSAANFVSLHHLDLNILRDLTAKLVPELYEFAGYFLWLTLGLTAQNHID